MIKQLGTVTNSYENRLPCLNLQSANMFEHDFVPRFLSDDFAWVLFLPVVLVWFVEWLLLHETFAGFACHGIRFFVIISVAVVVAWFACMICFIGLDFACLGIACMTIILWLVCMTSLHDLRVVDFACSCLLRCAFGFIRFIDVILHFFGVQFFRAPSLIWSACQSACQSAGIEPWKEMHKDEWSSRTTRG